MGIFNRPDSYGSIAKWFHWLTALLILGSYLSIFFMQLFTKENTYNQWASLQVHFSIGLTIVILVILRIIWRVIDHPPALEEAPKIQQIAAQTVHYLLYIVILITPITGYLGAGENIDYLFLYDVPAFQDTSLFKNWGQAKLGLDYKQFKDLMRFIHQDILASWIVWILILGHTLAALYHHFILKDRTLQRMTFRPH